MSDSHRKHAPLPTKQQLRDFLDGRDGRAVKREIMRAFNVAAGDRGRLNALLDELADEGAVKRGRRGRGGGTERLPRVALLEITGTDLDGEVMARPVAWRHDGHPPTITMAPDRRGHPALGPGDRVLARLERAGAREYQAVTIRRVEAPPDEIIGILRENGRLSSTRRGRNREFFVGGDDKGGARPGDLVIAEATGSRHGALRRARVTERLGRADGPQAVSLIAIHDHGIPDVFSGAAMDLAAQAGPAPLGGRADLRAVPLVTIDGADARDFDDAVFAAPDEDSANRDGWHLIVAIADVAWYVRPGDALDRAALDRGNSIYFPDRVVPMLPEALSNGWCSLKPGEDRPCMAAHLWIDKTGRLVRHRFERALMRSAARLTYEEVQAAADGDAAAMPAGVVDRLYGAYRALKTARDARQPLDLDLPERIIELDDKGRVETIGTRARLDSHRLIEEFMIAANVAAAETLEKLRQPCMYRVHDEPPPEKLVALRDVLSGIGLNFAKGQVVMPRSFNQILKLAEGTGDAPLVSEIVLRTQAQAIYSPENIGHFGLALRRYAHFTSPIRRYADLMVHRALISGIKAGPGGLPRPLPDFTTIGEHISMTERRAVEAERDAADRYTSAFLSDRVGEIMEARVTGVTRFGLFVTLAASGGDALLPMRDLPGGPYTHDTRRHVLRARRGKKLYRLGDTLSVRLTEADPITGGLVVRLSETR